MKKHIIIFCGLFTILFTSCQEKPRTKEMDEFVAEFDGMNLEEISMHLNNTIRTLEYYNKLGGSEIKIENIAKENEKFRSFFKMDTSKIAKVLQQFKKVRFSQTIKDTVSEFTFYRADKEFGEDETISLTKNKTDFSSVNTQSFSVNTIYYKNKERETENLKNYAVNFGHFSRPWGNQKIIDSVSIAYKLSYLKAYDSVVLSNNARNKKYKNGEIQIKKLENNYAYVLVSDNLKELGYHIYAFNKEGKPLSEKGSTTSSMSIRKTEKRLGKFIHFLKKIHKLTKENSFKTKEEFITHLNENITSVDFLRDEDNVYHHELYYNGNIAEVRIYIETDREEKTKTFTAVNLEIENDLFMINKGGKIVFIDENLEEVFETNKTNLVNNYGNYYREGEEKEDPVYFLSASEKKLIPIEAIRIIDFQNGLFGLSKKQYGSFKIYDKNNKPINTKEYSHFLILDNKSIIVSDTKEGNLFLINDKQKIKQLKNIADITNNGYSEGLIIAYDKKDKGGYIDVNGKIMIPFRYKYARKFSEGLAAVAKEDGLFGYINKQGKVVLPFKYDRADAFTNGIAVVGIGDYNYIINTKGNVIAKGNRYKDFSTSWKGREKIYTVNNKKYNSFGELIKE